MIDFAILHNILVFDCTQHFMVTALVVKQLRNY